MGQRRTFPRLRRRLQLELDGAVLGYTVDVSAGGFQVEHLKPLPRGLTGSLVGPGGRYAFTGKITWNEAGVPTAGIRSRSGVQLSGIDPGYYTWLMKSAQTEPAR